MSDLNVFVCTGKIILQKNTKQELDYYNFDPIVYVKLYLIFDT